MKKIILALMCILVTQSVAAFSVQSLLKIAGIVTATGLLTAVRVENCVLKAVLFPASFKIHAENKDTQHVVDLNVQFNLVPLIAGYWALKKL